MSIAFSWMVMITQHDLTMKTMIGQLPPPPLV